MRNRKRRIEFFSLYNHTSIAAHLEKMAQKGWLLEEIRNTTWIYRRIEPKKLHFAVSYYPKASEYDPEPAPEQQDFWDFCAHTGWVLACTSAQMQIFYNEQENPVPIDTDPELEVETIHATVWKSYFPAQIVLLVMGLIILYIHLLMLVGNTIAYLSSPAQLFGNLCWVIVIFMTAMELIVYGRWHKKAEEAAENGIFLDSVNTTPVQIACLAVVGVAAVYLVLSYILPGDTMMLFLLAAMSVYLFLLFPLVQGVTRLLKRRKASRNANRIVTSLVSFSMSSLMCLTVILGTWELHDKGYFDKEEVETYEYLGMTWELRKDEIPLKLEDFMEVDSEIYTYARRGDTSLLVSDETMTQQPRFDVENHTDLPELTYRVVKVHLPFLYNRCRWQMEKDLTQAAMLEIPYEYRDKLEAVDATPWGAEEAYYVVNDSNSWESNRFYLCYEDRFVDITFDWTVTEEQKKIVADLFG